MERMNTRCYLNRVFTAFVALFLVASMGGCSFLKPLYKRPELPVSGHYPSNTGEIAATGLEATATGWRDYFIDKKLCFLIEQALKNNRDLRIAVYRVEEARAQYGIRRADQFPTINAGADWVRQQTPKDLSLSGKRQISNQYEVNLNSVAWEVDFWGRVRNLKDAALENYLATDAARQAVAISLIANVADSYLRLCEFDERIILTMKTIETREEGLRIFKRRFEEGSISRLDVEEVETLLKEAQALGAQLQQERAIEVNFLIFLIGSPVDLGSSQGSLSDFDALPALRAGLPSELLNNRPDIMAAEHQLVAANANIGAARAAFFPRVTLTGDVGTASAQFAGLFAPESLAWMYGPTISMPIFDAGRTRNNLNLAEARSNVAVAQYERTIQAAFREVADALSSQKWLIEQVRIQQEALAVQLERSRLAKLRYDRGKAAFLEVLDAERNKLSTEQKLLQARRALLSSRVNLYAAFGGGSQTNAIRQAAIEDLMENLNQRKGK